jgi:hypothetical protein
MNVFYWDRNGKFSGKSTHPLPPFSAGGLRLISYQSLCTLPYPLHTRAHTKEIFEEIKKEEK